MNKTVSIIIPSFNAKELLRENLPILIQYSLSLAILQEIIIVDDGSSDGSRDFLRENFPQVKVISLGKNYGFSYACDIGARYAKGQILYFLNSDIAVLEGFLEPLLAHFEKDDIFAASSIEKQTTDIIGIPLVKFKWGIFWYWYEELQADGRQLSAIEVFCVSGGHAAYNREKFLSLGGFDTIFWPIYGEDGDICWRAWKRGWKSLIEPKSQVIHRHKGTMRRLYSDSKLLRIHWKNRFLVTWKDITSKGLLMKHFFFLLPELLICPIIRKKEFSIGFFKALKQLPLLLKARKRDKVEFELYSDEDLFRRFSQYPQNSPFKILYLNETSNISGAEQSLLHLIKGLNKNKFEALFILPTKGPLVEELNLLGVKTTIVRFPPIRTIWGVFSTIRKIRKLVKTKDVQLLHSNGIRTNMYAAIAGKLENIPVVWHQRNLITNEIIDPDRLFSFLPDKIICNSYAIAKRLLRKNKLLDKATVVYNGVDINMFHPKVSGKKLREEFGINPEEVVIGIASRFSSDKGHEAFLKAAKIITTCNLPHTNYRFLIVGDAVFQQDRWRERCLRDMATRLGLSNKVIFTGFRKDMPEVYAAMDIFVLASNAEPCGRVLLEAMAAEKPVIATNSGGTPEIVEDGISGYLIEPRNPEALANKIALLLNNPELAKNMGNAGRNRIENCFKIEKNIVQIEKIYLNLLENEQK